MYAHEQIQFKTKDKKLLHENNELKAEVARICENLVETTAMLDKQSKEFEELRQMVENKEFTENNATEKNNIITDSTNNSIMSKKVVGKKQA